MKKYRFYTDPGHGWLAVKRQELIDLNIIEKISGFSYQKGQTVYLEEDCDASLFLAAKTIDPKNIICRHTDKRSPIRSYKNFSV